MFADVHDFMEDYHLFRSFTTINSKLNSPQLLTSNLSAIPNLLTIYKQSVDIKGLRNECLTHRSISAAKLIVSLKLMEQDIEIVNKPLKLVESKHIESRKIIVNVGARKMDTGVQLDQLSTIAKKQQKEDRILEEIGVGKSDWNSNSQIVNKQQSGDSISPIFTQMKIQEKPTRRKIQVVNAIKQCRSSNQNILGNQEESDIRSQQQLLKEYFVFEEGIRSSRQKIIKERKDTYSKPKLQLEEFFQTKHKPLKQFSPEIYVSEAVSNKQQSWQQQSQSENVDSFTQTQQQHIKPIQTQETHLHSSPNRYPNRSPSIHQRTHLKLSPQVLSIHQVLQANRTSRSRDSQRQRHITQFNQKVSQQLKQIKQELREIRHIHNEISQSRLSDRRMQSRITSKGTFNPYKNKERDRQPSQPRILKFDISLNSSSTPKPSKQLLTMSRAVNIRSDTRPTSSSRSLQKTQVVKEKPSHQQKREEKSLQNFQKAMQIAKPRHRQLLTTRIAKYN